MGIVLKRRDNADIVKHVYGTIIDILINKLDLEGSIKFCQEACEKLLRGSFPLEMLIITKSLRGFYKNPDQIAHKVLADRIGERNLVISLNQMIVFHMCILKQRRHVELWSVKEIR